MTTQPKPRYPSSVFRQLKNYPVRYCKAESCRKQLTPRLKGDGTLESVASFKARRTCGGVCKGLVISQEYEKRRARLQKQPVLADPTYGGPPAPEEVAEELEPELDMVAEKPSMAASSPRDPRLNRPVRPVKMPNTQPIERPPVPPPSLQAKLPDPRPSATPFTATEGEIIERGDFGTCPNQGCGKRLNAFGRCGPCEQRKHWLKGQRAKVGAA